MSILQLILHFGYAYIQITLKVYNAVKKNYEDRKHMTWKNLSFKSSFFKMK